MSHVPPFGSTVTIPAPCADPQVTPDALDNSSLPPLTPQDGHLANSSASSLIPDPFCVPHHGEICDNSALFISAIADEADLLSSEETKERHQQPPDSTKQAETHVEELFGPLKQLFDEAHQQHPSPLVQQQDQDSSIWTHQQPPSVVKEDPFLSLCPSSLKKKLNHHQIIGKMTSQHLWFLWLF